MEFYRRPGTLDGLRGQGKRSPDHADPGEPFPAVRDPVTPGLFLNINLQKTVVPNLTNRITGCIVPLFDFKPKSDR